MRDRELMRSVPEKEYCRYDIERHGDFPKWQLQNSTGMSEINFTEGE
jgi:hypothetical protein